MSRKPSQGQPSSWQPSSRQPIQVNHNLYELLIQSQLQCAGIYDTESYFRIWRVRIIVWIVICAYVGYINGGVTAMLLAALIGMVMPLVAPYLGYVLLAILLQLVAYMVGVCCVYLGAADGVVMTTKKPVPALVAVLIIKPERMPLPMPGVHLNRFQLQI